MNILLVHSFWHPRGGDTTSLALQQAALAERGHTLVPFGQRHPDNEPQAGDAAWPGWVDPASPPTPSRIWSFESARALRRMLAAGSPRFDVAHVHHLHRHLTPSVLRVLHEAAIPVVWTLHDYELTCATANHYRQGQPCVECSSGTLLPALRHGCARSPTRGRSTRSRLEASALVAEKLAHRVLGAIRWVDAFVAPSRYLADHVAAALHGARIEHIRNPLPAARWVDGPREGVLYAGRLVEEKGVFDVLTIARALPETQFTLLGDGPLLGAVRAANLPNVQARGATPRDRVLQAMQSAAAVLVPSRWPENDPYAVTEAQRAGAVVFASRIGGIPEQISSGSDGVLCPPGDPAAWITPLRRMLGSAEQAHEIGVRAHRRVQTERDARDIAISLERLYVSLV